MQDLFNSTIKKFRHLGSSTREEIGSLVALRAKGEKYSLSYPFDPSECDRHYLLFLADKKEETLVSVLAACKTGQKELECVAFTHPDFRENGFFTELFEELTKDFPGCDIFFATNGVCPDRTATLEAIGAQKDHQEYLMERSLAAEGTGSARISHSSYRLFPSSSFSPDEKVWNFAPENDEFLAVGTVRVSMAGDGCVCVHHLEIFPDFRSQGFADSMLLSLFDILLSNNISKIILHVSGNNTPAVSLYKKHGFAISKTVTYYVY